MIHETLRPNFNIIMLLASGVLTFVMTFVPTPQPWKMTVLGALLGLVLGLMQSKGLHEAGDSMRVAKTAMEVRSTLKQTTWGRRYIYALWISVAVLLGAWFTTSMKNSLPLLAGYFAMMFVREMLTIRHIFRLKRLPGKTT